MSYEQIIQNLYHIGDSTTRNGLDCNPYLLLDGEEAVVFDPGSSLDFAIVLENLKQLVPLDRIKYIVIHHEDPDFCLAVPLLEQEGVEAQVVTSWRTMTLAQYYGIQSPAYLIEDHGMKLTLKSGRELNFLPTPYLHFAGAFATYDRKQRILFSSDLFGAFSYNRTLYADDAYMGKMLSFHEHYMPSNAVLRPVMELLLQYDIAMILPQHGSIIDDNITEYIQALRTLECGTMLAPLKKNLMQSGGFVMVYQEVYGRLRNLYPQEEVDAVIRSIPELELGEDGRVQNYQGDPEQVWEEIFHTIAREKGMIWITVMEPFVRNLCAVYDLKLPQIFLSTLTEITNENSRLQGINIQLDQAVKHVNERLLRCTVTGLYNGTFLKSLLLEELEQKDWRDLGALAFIGIDKFEGYKLRYGSQEEETVLQNMTYLLKEAFGENAVFRMEDSEFGLYLGGLSEKELVRKVDLVRTQIAGSELFLHPLTISVGIAFSKEISRDEASLEQTATLYLELALHRLSMAWENGINSICYQGDSWQSNRSRPTVLLVDSDLTHLEVLTDYFIDAGFEAVTATNGLDAYYAVQERQPDYIITETILDKMDGFTLREELLKNSHWKGIEMIYLSFKKDLASVERSLALGVTYYLHKPFLPQEVLGIVKVLNQRNPV